MLYKRIRELREESRLTQLDIANQLKISQAQYIKYEDGLRTLPARYLIQLADMYHVPTDYIVDRTDCKIPNKRV